ncbi:MAG: nucleotide sugar dehydrogenase [Legionella sp.]|nr:nucleotide sugar dehydrogenase [Legionella sp.]
MRTYAVIGIGYIGLELAIALSKHATVYAYDINADRINELEDHIDKNLQIMSDELTHASIRYTYTLEELKAADFFIVTVPTPAFFYETPLLSPLIKAVEMLASILKKNDIIVFESTVYPGATEEVCIPILEKNSHLLCGKDFNVGYSPEQINPGDKAHALKNMTKIISAQNESTLAIIKETYQVVCKDTYTVSNIPTAEAIKILENTQRDVNIALMNELSKITHALELNMHEIIEGAKKKWNFVPYKPGLVGGHCISIDPHYLAFKAKRHSVWPELILAARKVNDSMPKFVIQSLLKLLAENQWNLKNISVGVFGISYKENSTDIRNSLTLKLIKNLKEIGFNCHVHDPLDHSEDKLDFTLDDFDKIKDLSVAIIAVGHDFYRDLGFKKFTTCCKKKAIIMDLPNLFIDKHTPDTHLLYWNL